MRVNAVHIVGALFPGIALENHVRKIRNIHICIIVAIKYSVAMSDHRWAYWNMNVYDFIFAWLFPDDFSMLVESREGTI